MGRVWFGMVIPLLSGTIVQAAEDVYAVPRLDDLRSKVLIWAAEQPGVDAAQLEALQRLWTGERGAPSPDEYLERVIESFALIHPGVAQLMAGRLPPSPNLLSESSGGFYRANVALFAGRLLVERRMYDEALEVLGQVDVREVVDPASFFFHRAVAAQGVLEIKTALDALDTLLNRTENVPVRYSTTAVLLQADLQNLREKSLGEIARLMSDSERRLELGRAGERVQGVQERIIHNLDELIKKLEAQGAGGGGGSGSNPSNESSGPAQDSTVKGATAPGLTDPKKLSKEGTWGNLPNKEEQAKAKQLINRNFPSHYRQAIEMYFKKLASRPAAEK